MSEDSSLKNENLDLLTDIIRGYSKYRTNFGDIYFKHLDHYSYQENINYYNDCVKKLESDGVLSEKQQIEEAYSRGIWSKKEEDQIDSIKKSISRLKETKRKLIYQSDKKRIEEQIFEQKKILKQIEDKKREFIILTSEQIASRNSSDFYLKNFVFKDEKLLKKFFENEEDFEYADDILINKITSLYSLFLEKTGHTKLKKLALGSEFQNILFVSDLPTEVFGKPIINLTRNQIDLLIWGKYFKNIIQNTTKEIPEGLSEDPEKFMEWVDGLKNKKDQKSKKANKNNQSSSKFLFGSSDEIKSITGQDISGNKILKEASERGGLNMGDLMNKHA